MKTIEKIANVDYNEYLTLLVIEKDQDLLEIFTDDISMSFTLVKTLSKEDKLGEETKIFIKEIFDKIILTKTSLVNKYLNQATVNGLDIKAVQIDQPQVSIPEPEPEAKKKRTKTQPELPRRYGLQKIEQDIILNGGKPTSAQLTALMINDLKNIYSRLNSRIVNDLLTDDPIYTDEDYRDIRSTIQIVKNKLRNLLKKK